MEATCMEATRMKGAWKSYGCAQHGQTYMLNEVSQIAYTEISLKLLETSNFVIFLRVIFNYNRLEI